MSAVKITALDNGPLKVEGPVTVCDSEGGQFEIPAGKPAVFLCRCGASSRKPFCDGTHKSCDFLAAERAG